MTLTKISTWANFKTELSTRKKTKLLQYEYLLGPDRYYIWFPDGDLKIYYILKFTDTTDKTDFDQNYKTNCNGPLDMIDSTTGIHKIRPRPVEGTFFKNHVYYTLNDVATQELLDAKLDSGACTFWSVSKETVTVGDDTTNYRLVKIKFAPTFNYYIEGGRLRLLSLPTDSEGLKAELNFLPGILNWKFIANKYFYSTDTDEKDIEVVSFPKFVLYDSNNTTYNNFQIELTHHKDETLKIEIGMRLYKAT